MPFEAMNARLRGTPRDACDSAISDRRHGTSNKPMKLPTAQIICAGETSTKNTQQRM